MITKKKTKKPRPPRITVTLTKRGGFRMMSYGLNAPDLRTAVPVLFGASTVMGAGETTPDEQSAAVYNPAEEILRRNS
jgi:hypothetical protein